MKIALVHDYLFEYGGAERVLEALHEIYPDAPVYTAFVDQEKLGIHWKKFAKWDIRESWLTKIPFYKKLFSPLRLFALSYFEQFDLSSYDVVISSSNAYFAKGVLTKSYTPHLCYCHTPPRSLYGYTTMTDWKKNPLFRIAGNWINNQIREDDYLAAQRVDYFIANSQEVKDRIKKYYGRDAVVINPPVDVPEKLSADRKNSKQTPYYLYVNRLAFSKHPELAVEVCTKIALPLKVVGQGKMMPKLQSIAGPTIEFLGAVDDNELPALYAGATALIYPVEDEDFGIVPVEAMGYGIPVIAHKSGGPKETIIEGETGIFFEELTAEALTEAIHITTSFKWSKEKIHKHALSFTKATFQKKIKEYVETVVKNHPKLLEEQIPT